MNKPYRFLQFKFFLIFFFFSLLSWGIIQGGYHLFYFPLNLSEWLEVENELYFIWGYWFFLFCGLLLITLRIIKLLKNFNNYLENEFDLDFKWYNLIDYYGSPSLVSRKESEKIFKHLTFSFLLKYLFNKSSWKIIVGFFFWLFYLFPIFILPIQQKYFLNNLKTIWNYQEPYLKLNYSTMVLLGEDFQLGYKGSYPLGKFSTGFKKWQLESGENLVISNLQENLVIDYFFKKGRIRKSGILNIKVQEPPKLEGSQFKIKGPFDLNPYNLEGVYSLIVDKDSLVDLTLNYQDDQEIKLLDLSSLLKKDNLGKITKEINKQKVKIRLKVIRDLNFKARVVNQYGQFSDYASFEILLRKNNPPSISILEPQGDIGIPQVRSISVDFIAKDDLAIKEVELWYQINFKEKLTKNYLLLKPPKALAGDANLIFISNFILDLPNLNVQSGGVIDYYLRVKDNQNIFGYSKSNQIKVFTINKVYEDSIKQGESISKEFENQKENFENLERDYEKLKILSEQKKINDQDLKNFEENINQISKKLQEDIRDLEEEVFQDKMIISKNFKDKLEQLKKKLKEIDKNYLQRMGNQFNQMIEKVKDNVESKDIDDFLKTIDLKKMERELEQTLNFLDNLKKLQKIDSLEKLSQNLYLRYKDLENYIVADLLSPEQIQQEGDGLAEELQFISEEFKKIAKKLPNMKKVNIFKKKIFEELISKKIEAFKIISTKSKDDDFLKERSHNLDQLRRNFAQLNNFNEDQDHQKLYDEINYQIMAINGKIKWMESLRKENIYDLDFLFKERKRKLLTQFLSKQETLLMNFRETVFLFSSSVTLELGYLDYYDHLIEHINRVQKQISPDNQIGRAPKVLFNININSIKENYIILSKELIFLKDIIKKIIKDQKQNRQLSRTMEGQENLNNRIQDLLNKKNLSEREKKYLKNFALEQNFLRSLMEGLDNQQANKQNPVTTDKYGKDKGRNGESGEDKPGKESGEKKGQGDKGQGDKGGSGEDEELIKKADKKSNTLKRSSDRRRREIIEQMKELEKELLKENPDLKKIAKINKIIKENLFRQTQGLEKDEESNQENKREAERELVNYKVDVDSKTNRQKVVNKLNQENINQILGNSRKHNKEFRDRIKRFLQLNALN